MNILIADDKLTNRKHLRAIIEAEGQAVIEACDGLEALALLEHQPVDAIISDILMPNMDGYGLCFEVRRSERWCQIPFVFYTATFVSPADEKFSLDLGADAFLRKPALGTDIIAALRIATQAKTRMAPRPQLSEETAVLKGYSQRLVAKLVEKNTESADTIQLLEDAAQREHMQSMALASAANAVVITDSAGIISWVNPAFYKMTGYALDEVIGQTPRILKSGRHGGAFYRHLWERIGAGHTWHGEFTNRHKDGNFYQGSRRLRPCAPPKVGLRTSSAS